MKNNLISTPLIMLTAMDAKSNTVGISLMKAAIGCFRHKLKGKINYSAYAIVNAGLTIF